MKRKDAPQNAKKRSGGMARSWSNGCHVRPTVKMQGMALATFQLPAFCHAASATKQHVPHGRHDHDQPLETTEGNNQTDITIITSLKN